MQRAFIIMSLSMRAVRGASSSSRNVECIISHAAQVTLFYGRILSGYSPAFKLAMNFGKHSLTHGRALVSKY